MGIGDGLGRAEKGGDSYLLTNLKWLFQAIFFSGEAIKLKHGLILVALMASE